MTNLVLREYVTSIGFQLSLSKRQLEHLVYQDLLRLNGYDRRKLRATKHGRQTHPDTYIASMRALRDRGIVEWTAMDSREPSYRRTIARLAERAGETLAYPEQTYNFQHPKLIRITKAGRLVIALLKEAGIYQDIAADFALDESAVA